MSAGSLLVDGAIAGQVTASLVVSYLSLYLA